MARIAWVEDEEARGELARIYDRVREGYPTGARREHVPDIIRTMSIRPDFLAGILDAARLHFTDGALTRPQHEMIASYVSAINNCDY